MKDFLATYFAEYTKLAFNKSIYQTNEEFKSLAVGVQSADAIFVSSVYEVT